MASDTEEKIARSFELAVNDSTRGRKDNRGVAVDHGSIERTTLILATVGRVSPLANVEAALSTVQKMATPE